MILDNIDDPEEGLAGMHTISLPLCCSSPVSFVTRIAYSAIAMLTGRQNVSALLCCNPIPHRHSTTGGCVLLSADANCK